jgi:hypothetical protein
VNDQPDIAADPDRPEVFVLGLVELVELHAGIGRVHLQVKGRGLHGLLLVTGQSGEAVGKRVGDAEFHQNIRPSFITKMIIMHSCHLHMCGKMLQITA